MAIDPRFLADSGLEVFSGNELLVKGALETDGGVHLYTGYPGSPVAGFFDCLGDLAPMLQEKGVRAFQANNEALGAAAVNGSQMAPMRAIAAMKSVGVHVAADALAWAISAAPTRRVAPSLSWGTIPGATARRSPPIADSFVSISACRWSSRGRRRN